MTVRSSLPFVLAVLAVACSETKTGLRVSVDPGDFKHAATMQIAISALAGGFRMQDASNVGGAYVTTEDYDGDGALDLLARFNGPFTNALSFRVDTDNKETLAVHVTALAFNDQDLIAGGEGDGSLPAGSEGVVAFKLGAQMGPVGANTRTTDLKTATADVTVKGRRLNARTGPIAVCNPNGDLYQDLVIGAPDDDDSRNLGAVGSLTVVFGGSGAAAIDLSRPGAGQEIHFYGVEGGDHLGYAVACAELNGDMFDDIIVGAPGQTNGPGQVYVIYGRAGLSSRTIDLEATSPQEGASVRFMSALPGARLGSALHAANLDGTGPAEVLMAAPGASARRVYMFAALPPLGSMQAVDVDAAMPPHVTFSGVSATAIAAGDLDGAGAADIALADRNFIPPGTINPQGVVYVLPGVDPATARTVDIATTTPLLTLSGGSDGSLLGSAVLIANTSGRGADLFVSAPGDGERAGKVYIYKHESNFFLSPTRTNPDGGTLTGPVPDGRFGEALAASGAPDSARLLVGAPATRRHDRDQAGAAYAYVANSSREYRLVDQMFGAAGQDHMGAFVAGGLVNGDQIGDLVTSAPDATGSESGSGVVYVRLGR